MNKNKTPFSIDTEIFSDDRGTFAPFFDVARHKDIASEIGVIKRVYYVHNHVPNVIRGFHYHKKEWKIFTVVSGAAKFLAVNPEKPEERYLFVSSERKNRTIVIPPKFANGWMSLENNTVLVCASNLTTDESRVDDKRFDPFTWGDVWLVKGR